MLTRATRKPVPIAAVLLLTLGGCAMFTPASSDRAVPMPTPVMNHAEIPATDAGDVDRFAPPVDGPFDLGTAIDFALKHNPEVVAMGHDAEAARAREEESFGARLPSLMAEGGYTRYLDDQRLVPARYNGEPGVYSDSIYAAGLVLRIPLFTGGRLVNEERAASLLSQAAEHRLGRTREELVFNVTSVFYHILTQQKVLESLETSREVLTSHLEHVNDLIAAQKATRVDRLRTEVRLADLQQRIVAEQNVLAIQKRLLANLMGRTSIGEEVEMDGTLEETTADRAPSRDEAIAAAFSDRSDYLAARKELDAQARRLDAARAAYAPTINLVGKYGWRWADDPTRQPSTTAPSGSRGTQTVATEGATKAGDDSEDVGELGLSMDIPIFQGGQITARVKGERAKLESARERLRRLELQIRLEVESALLNLDSAAERARTLRKAVEQAEESLREERQKYDVGKGTIVDVLDAQSALLEAQTNYYRALADIRVARAQIDLATGARK